MAFVPVWYVFPAGACSLVKGHVNVQLNNQWWWGRGQMTLLRMRCPFQTRSMRILRLLYKYWTVAWKNVWPGKRRGCNALVQFVSRRQKIVFCNTWFWWCWLPKTYLPYFFWSSDQERDNLGGKDNQWSLLGSTLYPLFLSNLPNSVYLAKICLSADDTSLPF